MQLNGVTIFDTFAEAWDLEVVRLALTALTAEVAMSGALQFVGAAGSSMIGSRINAGIERPAHIHETPDGRPGVFISLTMPPDHREAMLTELELRFALASLIPTIAIFDAPVADITAETVNLHDTFTMSESRWSGYDTEQSQDARVMCVVPTTTGEFVYQKTVSISTSGTDGHIVCFAKNSAAAIQGISAATRAITAIDGVAPMGYGLEQVYREYDYIPSLKDQIADSKVPDGVESILNLLMFGASPALMKRAIAVSLRAAATVPDVLYLGAMNFGGEFGRHQYHLHQLLEES